MLAKAQLSEIKFELKSPYVSVSHTSAGRETFECVVYFIICILRAFKELADLCREWTWVFACSESLRKIHPCCWELQRTHAQ